MPMTCPWASSSGPPELPGLIGASVCSRPRSNSPSVDQVRFTALIMPCVTVSSDPNGVPIAMAVSPTATWLESASWTAEMPAGIFDTRMRARSSALSVPTTVAVLVAPVLNLTVTLVAPSTTWLLVRIRPLVLMTNPDPIPLAENCRRPAWLEEEVSTSTTDGPTDLRTAPATFAGAADVDWTTGCAVITVACATWGVSQCAVSAVPATPPPTPPVASASASKARVPRRRLRRGAGISGVEVGCGSSVLVQLSDDDMIISSLVLLVSASTTVSTKPYVNRIAPRYVEIV